LAVPAIWVSRREKGARFLLAWIVPAWIVLELVVTKLPHYVLPFYPAIAILIAGVIDPHVLGRQRWLKLGLSWWFVFPVIVGIVGIAVLVVLSRQLGLLAWPFAAGAVIFGLFAWRLYDADGAERSMLRAMVASLLIAVTVYGVVMPSLGAAFPSAALARTMRNVGCPTPLAAAAGYHEPSLVLMLGTSTRLTDGVGAADFLRIGGCRFALIESRQERAFLRRAEAIGLRYTLGPRVEGINIANGRQISIAIYRTEMPP
jgi:4-amino-4-deoxy-L-arabinose transferase-like glycosyltransferase